MIELFMYGIVPIIVGLMLISAFLFGVMVPKQGIPVVIPLVAAIFPIILGVRNINDLIRIRKDLNKL